MIDWVPGLVGVLSVFALAQVIALVWQIATLHARSLEARVDRQHAREERQSIMAEARSDRHYAREERKQISQKVDAHILHHNGGRKT